MPENYYICYSKVIVFCKRAEGKVLYEQILLLCDPLVSQELLLKILMYPKLKGRCQCLYDSVILEKMLSDSIVTVMVSVSICEDIGALGMLFLQKD